MFRFLRRKATRVAMSAADSWSKADTCYVGLYRHQFDSIAEELSKFGPKVWTRFDSTSKRVEVCSDGFGIIASVVMSGEVGAVYETLVTIRSYSKESVKSVFTSSLPHVKFVSATPG